MTKAKRKLTKKEAEDRERREKFSVHPDILRGTAHPRVVRRGADAQQETEKRDPRIPADFDFNRKNWLDQITMHPDLVGGSIDFDGVRLISRKSGKELEVVDGELRRKPKR